MADTGRDAETAVRIIVRGRVQGVGYRAFVLSQAQARGIAGWVRNRRNGDVEAVFAGPGGAVKALCEICREGPPYAAVEALDIIPADRQELSEVDMQDRFVLRPTL
ncbi:MAG: acylphosphatase [Beijerinckiaceae bacterium]|nr:MAG: acylphosphatase [Beijerinckiaceae bacterium]